MNTSPACALEPVASSTSHGSATCATPIAVASSDCAPRNRRPSRVCSIALSRNRATALDPRGSTWFACRRAAHRASCQRPRSLRRYGSRVRALVVLVDGADHDPSVPAVLPLDPGLLGQGVYESIRTYDGVPFGLAEHLERLAGGAAALAIDCPTEAFAREVPEAVRLRA